MKKYTGINKIFHSIVLQDLLDRRSDGSFREFFDDWKWIFSFSKRHIWAVLIYAFLGFFASTLSVGSSYISAITINIITGKQKEKLVLLLCLMIGSSLFNIVFDAVKNRLQAKITIRVHNDIQAEIYHQIIDVKWSELNKYSRGDLLNRFNYDVNTVSDNAISWIPDVLVNLYTFALTFVLLFKMDPVLAWIGLCSAPILFFISRYLLKKQKQYRMKILELNSSMMSFEAETFYNMDTLKAFGIWDVMMQKLDRWQKQYQKDHIAYEYFHVRMKSITSLLNLLVTMSSFCYCLFRLWNGQILYGDMTFFLNQRSTLTTKFEALIKTIPNMLNAAVSTHHIREIVDLPKEEHDEALLEKLSAKAGRGLSIEMNNASFAYVEGKNVYENANFVVKPGEIVALMGESGGGKTTLFRLLLGLIAPNDGEVVIRDMDGKAVPMAADLRKLVSYVPQGNTLIMGSIADNMRMVRKNATDEEIIEALKIACAWDFVEPLGIDSEIGERGKGLSEGQAQRISIARAVLRDAPILFLDEATSALDEETEAAVIDNVVRTSPTRAIIVSTHRPFVLKKCSRIYKIRHKQIIDTKGQE